MSEIIVVTKEDFPQVDLKKITLRGVHIKEGVEIWLDVDRREDAGQSFYQVSLVCHFLDKKINDSQAVEIVFDKLINEDSLSLPCFQVEDTLFYDLGVVDMADLVAMFLAWSATITFKRSAQQVKVSLSFKNIDLEKELPLSDLKEILKEVFMIELVR